MKSPTNAILSSLWSNKDSSIFRAHESKLSVLFLSKKSFSYPKLYWVFHVNSNEKLIIGRMRSSRYLLNRYEMNCALMMQSLLNAQCMKMIRRYLMWYLLDLSILVNLESIMSYISLRNDLRMLLFSS